MSMERLIDKIRNNDVILWVGAGFSLYAGMPNVEKIKKAILDACTDEEKVVTEKISDLSDRAKEFVEMRNGSKNELGQILSNLIDIDPLSLKTHTLVSEIPQINTIITTNYDTLFEEAYGSRRLTVIKKDINIPYAVNDRVHLYKIHGDIKDPDSLVITKNDYTNFFRSMNQPIWTKVKSLLAEKTILFIGYSLEDQNIDFLLDDVISSLGENLKESFLVTPNLPKHKISRLNQKKIQYINSTGEELIKEIHTQVKKKLIVDTLDNKVPAPIAAKQLSQWGLSVEFLTSQERISYQNFKALDGSSFKVTFDVINFNLNEQLQQKSYDVIEVDNSHVTKIITTFKDIEIPMIEQPSKLYFNWVPKSEFKAEVSISHTDIFFENVLCQSYGHETLDLIRLTHEKFTLTFNLNTNKFNFKINKLKTLRENYQVFGMLYEIIHTGSSLIINPTDMMKTNIELNEFDFDFQLSTERDNISENEHRYKEEIRYIFNLVKDLQLVESYYRVRFRNFYFNLDNEEHDILKLLVLSINGQKEKVKSIKFTVDISDPEGLKKSLREENPVMMRLEFKSGMPLSLFGQAINIGNKYHVIQTKNVVVKNKVEVLKRINRNQLQKVPLHIEGNENSLERWFETK